MGGKGFRHVKGDGNNAAALAYAEECRLLISSASRVG